MASEKLPTGEPGTGKMPEKSSGKSVPPPAPTDLAAATLASVRKANRDRPRARNSRRSTDSAPRPGQFSGAGRDERDPALAREAVTDLVAQRGWSARTRIAAVIGRWADVAGTQLADHVRATRFDEETGLLVLQADSTTWATQTRVLVPHLLGRLDELIEPGIVRQIEVQGPSFGRRGYGRLRVPGRGPRDTYG